jgi:hypothetical protein
MRMLGKFGLAMALAIAVMMPAPADAAILLTPGNSDCLAPGTSYSQDLQFLGGEPAPNNGCGLDTTGFVLAYKDNEGGAEEGPFAGNYHTSYFNGNLDALIEWTGGAFITCGTCWLVAKDGNHDPGWYGWNLQALNWDGKETLDIRGLFPTGDGETGAISHFSIWRIPNGGGGEDTQVPEPASLLLFGLGALAAGYRARRTFRV